jgi:hypothetical protein
MTLVRIVKDYDSPNILRQTSAQNGIWDGIQFTTDPCGECDYLIFLNNKMTKKVTVKCPPENIWAIMQEPYYKGHSDWLMEKHDYFAKVFTHHPPAPSDKYISSHPALPWYIDKTYDQLVSCEIPLKTKSLSWVIGNATDLPGHFKRLALLKTLPNASGLGIDLFGRAVNPINDKWQGLSPYKYSLAIENSSSPDYWTEKIADCFLAWTVPIYYGCVNIENYFPEKSFIRIDINNPAQSLNDIKEIVQQDNWEDRNKALAEARELILKKYQLFPFLAEKIITHPTSGVKKTITIPAYRRSFNAFLNHRIYKFNKKIGF